MSIGTLIPAIAAAYLIGSIPFGVLVARLRGVDIRAVGSGNIGATNVGRVLGRKWGILCFVLDGTKGLLPVLLYGLLIGPLRQEEPVTALAIGSWMVVLIAAVAGHMASIFLGFRGGKGVATGFGGCLGLWPALTIPVLVALLIWIVTLRVSRIVSLASVAAAGAFPVLVIFWALAPLGAAWSTPIQAAWPACVMASLLGGFVVYRHRSNIARIRRGEEPRVGEGGAVRVRP